MERPHGVTTNESLAHQTTFKIGGPADFFVSIDDEAMLRDVLQWAMVADTPVQVLGGGSNVVFTDAGFRGLVVQMATKGISVQESKKHVLVTVAAGVQWDACVAHTVEQGWWGLENLSAIPGSVGAAPIQNIGAYGVEVGAVMDSVRVYVPAERTFRILSADECSFSYRDSIFKHQTGQDLIVTAVTFRLTKMPHPITHYPDVARALASNANPSQAEIRKTIRNIRAQKFPDLTKVGTAGSFFKNPVVSSADYQRLQQQYPALPGYQTAHGVKLSAAWLIDNVAGARGARAGRVGTHDTQALVFVNHGGATAAELDAFANHIATTIYQKTGVMLEREVNFIAEK